jgi:hypothetical protein
MGSRFFELLRERRRLGEQLWQRQRDEELREATKGTRFEAMVEKLPNEEALTRASKANWAAVVQDMEKTGGEFAGQFSKAVAEPFEKAGKFIGAQIGKGIEDSMLEKGRGLMKNFIGTMDIESHFFGNDLRDWWQQYHLKQARKSGWDYFQHEHTGPLSQTVPATEGRYLTGGGNREVNVDGMDESIRVQRDTRDAIRDLARALQHNPATVIDLR